MNGSGDKVGDPYYIGVQAPTKLSPPQEKMQRGGGKLDGIQASAKSLLLVAHLGQTLLTLIGVSSPNIADFGGNILFCFFWHARNPQTH